MPEWYLNEPVILPGEEFYLNAFHHLCTEKSASGLIPWRAIRAYADAYSLDKQLTETFVQIILYIDSKCTEKFRSDLESKQAIDRAKSRDSKINPRGKVTKSRKGFLGG